MSTEHFADLFTAMTKETAREALMRYVEACERMAASFGRTMFVAMRVDDDHFKRGCRATFQALEALDLLTRAEESAFDDIPTIRAEAIALLHHEKFDRTWAGLHHG